MKQLIKRTLPPILLDGIKKLRKGTYGWHGDYSGWDEAKKKSIGYNTDEILKKVKASILKVKEGEAIYERDSVLFDKIQYSWPLLCGLMFAAAKSEGVLNVLDFGGSLGSTYYQNKKFLDKLYSVTWNIVEQKHFVDAGRREFEDENLHFYYDIKSCLSNSNPKVLVMSSVLQYIEKPYKLLDEILDHEFDIVLIDRTPFSVSGKAKIKIQRVPPNIYKASYPCHFFDENSFINYLCNKKYSLMEQFNALDGCSDEYKFKGMIFIKDHHV